MTIFMGIEEQSSIHVDNHEAVKIDALDKNSEVLIVVAPARHEDLSQCGHQRKQ